MSVNALKQHYNLIHLFTTADSFYCYLSHTNSVVELDEESWQVLNEEKELCHKSNLRDEDSYLYELLNICGVNKQHPLPTKFYNPWSEEEIKKILSTQIAQLVIDVTKKCNLGCDYCVFGPQYSSTKTPDGSNISFEIGKQAIDFYLRNSVDQPEKSLGFYGGEPLLLFPIVKQLIEYFIQEIKNFPRLINITTNATLLTNDMIEFFVKNNVDICISLDGYKDINDRHRKLHNGNGVFSIIMNRLQYIKEKYPEFYVKHVCINSVLTPDNDIEKTYTFFNTEKTFSNVQILTSYVRPFDTNYHQGFTTNRISKQSERKLRKQFILKAISNDIQNDWFLRNLYCLHLSRFINRNAFAGFSESIHPNGICLPGARKIVADSLGHISLCERVPYDLFIGDIFIGFDYQKIQTIINNYIISFEHECVNCWANRLCQTCFAQISSADLTYDKEIICESSRRNIAEDLELYFNIIEKNPSAFDFLKIQ